MRDLGVPMDLFKRAQSEETSGGFHPTSGSSSSTTVFVGPLPLDLGQRTTRTNPRLLENG